MQRSLFLLLIGVLTLLAGLAQAATFTFVSGAAEPPVDHWTRTRCNIRLDGEIVAGDAARFQAFLAQASDSIEADPLILGYPRIATLCLNSSGGSFDEGIRIAELIRQDRPYPSRQGIPFIVTRLEAGAECLSACAIIFMAGTFDDFEGEAFPMRSMHPTARLGFHAPALVLPTGQYNETFVSAAYGVSIDAIAAILRVLHVGADPNGAQYSGDYHWMDASLLAEMLATPPTSMRFITTVDDVGRWQIPVYPIADVLPDLRSGFRACINRGAWQDGRPSSSPSELAYASNGYDDTLREVSGSPEVRHMTFSINELDGIACRVSVRENGGFFIEPHINSGAQFMGSMIDLHDPATSITSLTINNASLAPQVAVEQPSPVIPTQSWGPRFGGDRVTYWDHNGSGMAWESRGTQRWVWYYRPRPGLIDVGVAEGTLLFNGTLTNGQLTGQARRFSLTCGDTVYQVSGPAVGTMVVLEGSYQGRNQNCQFGEAHHDRLSFTYVGAQPVP